MLTLQLCFHIFYIIFGEGNGNPPVLLPRESHGQRSLVGYSSWGHKELDVTEVT